MKEQQLFLKQAMDKGLVRVNDSDKLEALVGGSRFSDSVSFNTLTTANVGLPSVALTSLMTQSVEIILSKRSADETVGPKEKMMEWEQEIATYAIKEPTGQVSYYSDFATPNFANLNVNFETIKQYRMSQGVNYGDLMAKQYGQARINYITEQTNGAAELIRREFNDIAYNGKLDVNGNQIIYGILNHPSLKDYETISTQWTSASISQIKNDISNLMSVLQKQAGGNVSPTDKLILAMPASTLMYLQGQSPEYGIPLLETIKRSYPTIEFVGDVFLEGASNNQNVVILKAMNNIGGVYDPCVQGYSQMMEMSRVVQDYNSYSQTMNAGGCGCVVYKPTFIVRARGV